MLTTNTELSEEAIARRAYEIWQSRGCPLGDGSEDWRAAESELISTRISRGDPGGHGVWNWWCRVRETITGRDSRS